jgi:uncharacterized protein (DUF305 family)
MAQDVVPDDDVALADVRTADIEAADDPPAEAQGRMRRSLSWPKVLALVLAFSFLAGVVGWYVGRGQPPGTGSVDAGALLDMAAHHEQAIHMANLELQDGDDLYVRLFAQEVLATQSYELGIIDTILDDWGYDRSDRPSDSMAWMGTPVPQEDMPGMATPEQLAELRDATGQDTDELFLELMAEHHRGAIHMASYAARNADDPQVVALTTRIAQNQAVEINEFIRIAEQQGLTVDIEPATVPDID